MTSKQTIRTKLALLRKRHRKSNQVSLPVDMVQLGLQAGFQMLLAAVTAGAVLLEERAPLAVALVGASGAGICAGATLVGACLGYLFQLEASVGLRYAAASILTFAVAFAFYDLKWFQTSWVMPVVTACVVGFTGLVSHSRVVWSSQELAAFGAEVVLTGWAVWCYRGIFSTAPNSGHGYHTTRQRMGILLLVGGTLAAMRTLQVGVASIGCMAGAWVVLLCAYTAGSSLGGMVGILLGGGMDLTIPQSSIYAVVWGISGVLTGLLRGRSRWSVALCYSLFGAFALLWNGEEQVALEVMLEHLLAAGLFLAVPQQWIRRMESSLTWEQSETEGHNGNDRASQKLQAASKAFQALYEALYTAFIPPKNDNNVAVVFDRTAGRVCRTCALWNLCWQREYSTTFNALNDATPGIVQRGRAQTEDFPPFFPIRCIKWGEFLATVNEEWMALQYRRQYNARIRENRAAVCRQYDQLSELLSQTARELSEELTPDQGAGRRVRQYMSQLGAHIKTGVYRDKRGLLHLYAEGTDCSVLERPSRLHELSDLLGVTMRLEQGGGQRITMVQQEPLMAVAGIAAQKKNGETVSGDAGTYFKCPDGTMYVLLCDGMGSGMEANRESNLAVHLLEQFLRAGIHAERALVTLASALALRGEETGGFTTVDLLSVDLFTGDGMLYKLGAAPTYVRQDGFVKRLTGHSLPAGLAEGTQQAVDQFSVHLEAGDCVLMISDGICGTQDDQWILDRLAQFKEDSPKELARTLLLQSPDGATDDRTALVVCVERRE